MEEMPDPVEEQAVYAQMGALVSQPEALAEWRHDPEAFHDKQKRALSDHEHVADYDPATLDRLMQRYEQMPENQMREIFTNLVGDAQAVYRTSLSFSRATFILGITIVTATFIVEILYLIGLIDMTWQGALAGGGVLGRLGVGTVIATLVKGPQHDLQGAIGNLAQVEIAFLAFTTQIRGIDWRSATTIEETAKLVELTSKLRRESMADIQKYLEGTRTDQTSV